jgi:hypothetical protein
MASIRAESGSATWCALAVGDPAGPKLISKLPSSAMSRSRSSNAVEPSGVELGV